MAYSAQISVTPGTSNSGQKLRCSLTITATPGSNAVDVLRITPYLLNAASVAQDYAGEVQMPIGRSVTITASSTAAASLAFFFDTQPIVAPAPLNPAYPSTPAYDTYTIGAYAYLSDGSTLSSSTTIYIYPLYQDSTLVLSGMPQPGSIRFDTNVQSGMFAAFYPTPAATVPAIGYCPRGPLPVSV